MLRFGIPNDTAFGVPMGKLLAFARKRPKDAVLAADLWQTGRYEARMLAILLDDPSCLTAAHMDTMVADFDNWAICDTACFHLFDRSPYAWDAVPRWATSDRLYTRRAAFALIWALSVHDKTAPDARFLAALTLCQTHATDPRPHVAKAVSMALRATGKRNATLRIAALEMAERLAETGPIPAKIGREALRELGKGKTEKPKRTPPASSV